MSDPKFFYKLLYDFPHLFPGGEESQIDVPKGWEVLVYDLCNKISERVLHNKEVPDVNVLHIKEKFAFLRYYISGGDDIIHNMIMEAEEVSSLICEVTGQEGFLCQKGGWLKTLCEEQAQSLGYTKVNTHKEDNTPWITVVTTLRT